MVRGDDSEPEAGQRCELCDTLGFAGGREVAVIVRVEGALLICGLRAINDF
jgi:hypothetical protein